ncbi:uncharacterized protein LOC130137640 [Syzygium oleosum]|uniref:uncharacterized protein LOC130137640 n=1 Tax=Syzygium oleosum TaxID=219896 RepID=UPI0024BB7838|nr:uncharacterized protein LOC130137640 [Syzygium oleosum]
MQMMVAGRTCLTVSPRLSISVLILVLLLLLFLPSASHGTSWRAGENANTAPYSSEITEGNRNTKMARDLVVGGYSSALVDVEGSARQVPTGPDPLHHRRKPVSP